MLSLLEDLQERSIECEVLSNQKLSIKSLDQTCQITCYIGNLYDVEFCEKAKYTVNIEFMNQEYPLVINDTPLTIRLNHTLIYVDNDRIGHQENKDDRYFPACQLKAEPYGTIDKNNLVQFIKSWYLPKNNNTKV